MDPRTWKLATDEIGDEQAAILKALHRFEDALVARPSQRATWQEHVRGKLAGLIEVLERHLAVAGSSTGIITLIESTAGHSSKVTSLVDAHKALVADARALRSSLQDQAKPEALHSPFRRAAARLASAVREYEAQESELISEIDARVSGGEG